ncbi:FAD-dependent oxidoreductase [Streptomyces sp. LHD-70]|uniref:flavin monoamine oxidase family protein n=1 Tax=Streptomyces sp. LHD-70 TaxID=3072140 RepID=UPI00280EF370|nr:FAD-dependent oxidoreductase [Streptomyces sp. LHD-70]MDQ8704087.1 FAD-dependent oxidoreductase [Streptomyces sp. LHD-70]
MQHDVLIVGAGAAGVTTAYQLRESGLDIGVYESSDRIGGRTRSVGIGGLAVNTGAMFIYRDTPAEALAAELGIRTEPFEPDTYGIHVHGRTVVDADNTALIARLPLDDEARKQLTAFVDEAMDEYRRCTDGGALASRSDELGAQSVEDRLTDLHPDVARIIRTAVRGGAVGKASQTTAQYGLRYFASYLAHEKRNRLFPVDGMQQLPLRMAEQLPKGTVHLGVTVESVEPLDDGAHRVRLREPDGSTRTVAARRVVVTVPAPQVPEVVPHLPGWKRDALDKALTPGSRTLAVVADVRHAPHLADWSFLTTVGTRFDAVINPTPGRPRTDPRTGASLIQYVCYGNSAGHQEGFGTNESELDAWVKDFLIVAPELRGHVVGVHGQTWPHCFSLLSPTRLSVLDALRRPVHGIEFAGDYTSATAGTHGCYAEAQRVAESLLRAESTAEGLELDTR